MRAPPPVGTLMAMNPQELEIKDLADRVGAAGGKTEGVA